MSNKIQNNDFRITKEGGRFGNKLIFSLTAVFFTFGLGDLLTTIWFIRELGDELEGSYFVHSIIDCSGICGLILCKITATSVLCFMIYLLARDEFLLTAYTISTLSIVFGGIVIINNSLAAIYRYTLPYIPYLSATIVIVIIIVYQIEKKSTCDMLVYEQEK